MYTVGEVVLLEWQGWLKAFRVAAANTNGNEVTYMLEMVDNTSRPVP
jgi:hypothetical protein